MGRWSGWLVALALLCQSPVAAALKPDKAFHDYVRARWSIQDGLPQVSVSCIAQDRSGYLWVGTQAGLARFDGVRFIAHTPDSDPGLPGVSIQALQLARDGRLWVGTYKGVAVHDGAGFTPLKVHDAASEALAVNAFDEDVSGRMWVATDTGVYRAAAGVLHRVEGSPASAGALLADGNAVWVGTRGAVLRVLDERWSSEPLGGDGGRLPDVHRLVKAQGRLWAATTGGLYVRTDGRWTRFEPDNSMTATAIELLRADRDGNLWAGGDAGLVRVREAGIAEVVTAGSPGSVAALRTAFEDREGSLWLGTRNDGLVRLRDSWTRRFTVPEGLGKPILWTLSPDPDQRRIWVGADDGISVLEGGRFRLIAPAEALPDPQPYNLLAEADRLWIGTRHGLAVIDHAGAHAGQVRQPAWLAPMLAAQINGLVRAADGSLWIATSEGVFQARPATPAAGPDDMTLQRYAHDEGLSDARVRYLLQTRDGRMLAGSQDGLFVLRGQRFERLGVDAGLPVNMDITSIAEIDDGTLLVGTLSEVSYAFDGERWHVLDAAHGLPANAAFFMVAYQGYLWSAGIRGISRVPLGDLRGFLAGARTQVRGEMLLNERGDSRSGQQGYCCNGAGNAKGFLQGGSLWLPSRDGVVALDMASIVKNPVPPGVVIERMQVGESWMPAPRATRAQLPADDRDVAFEFTVLSFQDPGSVGIEYRLDGYDRGWQRGDSMRRSVRYTNLPPGRYRFEVRGSNNAGVASRDAAVLAFSIAPLFYETAWFKALVALALLALILSGYRVQRRRYLQRHDALELLVRQRTEDLEQANSHLLAASVTDPLTGLRNRRYVSRQILADLSHYERRAEQGGHRGEIIACALLDLDHFKRINDVHGHAAGDSVLVDVAQVLTSLVRSADYVVRWGGEEFLLVFRPMPASEVAIIGQRLCDAIATHSFALGHGEDVAIGRVTCSVGIAQYPLLPGQRSAVRLEQLVELADRALYRVKSTTRNGWASLAVVPGNNAAALIDALRGHAERCIADGRLKWIGSDL